MSKGFDCWRGYPDDDSMEAAMDCLFRGGVTSYSAWHPAFSQHAYPAPPVSRRRYAVAPSRIYGKDGLALSAAGHHVALLLPVPLRLYVDKFDKHAMAVAGLYLAISAPVSDSNSIGMPEAGDSMWWSPPPLLLEAWRAWRSRQ